jgi:hypothetical protein
MSWSTYQEVTKERTDTLQKSLRRFENKALIEAAKNIKAKYSESEIQKTLLHIKKSNLGTTADDLGSRSMGAYVDHIISLSKDIETGEKPDTFDIKSTFNAGGTTVSGKDDFAVLTLGLTQGRYKEMYLNMLLHGIDTENISLVSRDYDSDTTVYEHAVNDLSGASNTFLLASPSIVQAVLSRKCE